MSQAEFVKPEPYWLITLGLVLGDQLTKYLVGRFDQPITLPGVSIGAEVNPAGAFGLQLDNAMLLLFGVVIIVGLLVLIAYGIERRPVRLGLWLIIGGALSNILDRLFAGGAVDIISIDGLTRFNLADVMIVLGAFSVFRGIWSK